MKKTLRITVNGKAYEVIAELLDESDAVTAPTPAPKRRAGAAAAAAASTATQAPASSGNSPAAAGGAGDLPSPLAGKVVAINAPVGTKVEAGQTIITLEAMKMNTTVTAPASGTVTAVHVQPGDGVEEGQPLLTIA